MLASEPLPALDGMQSGISVWTGKQLDAVLRASRAAASSSSPSSSAGPQESGRQLLKTIEILGARSQRAQQVNAPLTSIARMRESDTYRLYLLTVDEEEEGEDGVGAKTEGSASSVGPPGRQRLRCRRGIGILKIGTKKLFVTHPRLQSLVEVDARCVLDFYVDDRSQRHGYGKLLYSFMLEQEKPLRPEQLAIDRPSPKLIAFMRKHYHLANALPQVNNFVVYAEFFTGTTVSCRGRLERAPATAGGNGMGSGGSRVAASRCI